MVARLSPSFGIVGTVAGMVQLFRNMATQSGGLGGAMAMALLETLYGILFGTAVGGPMSTRLNQQLNEHLSLIDLLERQVAALIEEDRSRKRGSEAQA
jgi:chemotaxis protein MotA